MSGPAPSDVDLFASEERFRLLVEGVKDYAIFMLDAGGHVRTWNAGARRFKGYAADEIIGQHFSRFYPPEALARDLPGHELREAEATGSFEDEGWRVRKDGSLFWANVVITAVRNSESRLLGFLKITRDLTQRRNQEETLRRSEERFRLLVEGVKDHAIFMLDPNGHIVTWNSGAERIKGWTAEEIIGRHFSTFYPLDAKESGWPEHELQVAGETGSFLDEGWRIRKDGSRIWAAVTITALRDDDGRLIGFAKLTRDLTAQKRAEAIEQASQHREEILEAERTARMSAQRATRIKDEFLATLSHELRTPLNAVVGWTQILRRGGDAAKPGELQRGLEVIERNARLQAQLIDDLLDLSRITSGKVRLDVQELALAEVVQRAVDSARPLADAKGVHLEATLDAAPLVVAGDPTRLQQVLWNLLSNAVKFTPKGGAVRVRLERAGSNVDVTVSDTGAGIPAHFLPHVFDRFSQRDSSTTRSHGGLGLGLAISRHLVELHAGSLTASSAGEGRGATFRVELPLSPLHPALAVGEDDRRSAQQRPAGDGRSAPKLAGVHAMVVDDEPDARELLTLILQEHAATVSAFASAEEALASLTTSRPGVIISDIGMPTMDGYQFMRALRASESGGARIPAIALTAFARAEDRKRSLVAGYQAHLSKPFDLGELVLIVADLVKR